uniref:Scavenger receptor class B member 1 n=1 Tax=Parasteatoda tepidariorum TaxID=114398 RepID=A0A2L2XXN3_PARTP
MAEKCMSPKAAKWMIGIASVFFVLSIAILSIFPTLYKQMLAKTIALSDGSLGAKTWEEIPLPIYENIYFFNITNGDAFLNKDEPLNVTEVGPYVYKGKWIKHNPKWHPNGTVTYRETRVWHFQPELSEGSLDDVITTLNGPMIIGANMLKDWNIFWRIFYSVAMKFESESVIIQRKVRELTYEGYEDPIIKYAPVLKPNIPFKDGIFMWLYDKNNTDDGEFTVFTGADDASRTNVITSWNGNEKLNFWKGDSCNDINGTNVEMGPPLPDTPESYTFFQSIFCRSITYDYIGDTSSWGVPLKRFEPTAMVFGNSTENPDNACYEVHGERASGVLDVGPCQFDAPALLSYPHFHMADPSYVKAINGLSPKSDVHGSYMDVEPISGFTMNISIKFQMNIQMERVRGVLQFDNVPEGIFPVFWVDININLNEDWADFFKGQLNNPKYIVYSVCGFLLLASLVLIICGAVIITRSQKDDEDPLLNIQEEKKEELEKRNNTSEVSSSSYGGLAGDQGEQYDGDSLKQTDSHAAR